MSELLPCPFCGCADYFDTVERHGHSVTMCDNCGATGPYGLEPEQEWNTRTPSIEDIVDVMEKHKSDKSNSIYNATINQMQAVVRAMDK